MTDGEGPQDLLLMLPRFETEKGDRGIILAGDISQGIWGCMPNLLLDMSGNSDAICEPGAQAVPPTFMGSWVGWSFTRTDRPYARRCNGKDGVDLTAICSGGRGAHESQLLDCKPTL
mmetsp:Transcript_28788/g.76180  ORF Transcript_28788/g.76180 Transcript_28788/m.76180 type:complete len:117 (-) Transcript_28788:2882-3232(-)